ncbi:MAG: MFS transporter [Lentisphaeria bacterium]|nr:MFS transporter [Lentisphaeria bacterium]
MDTGNGSGGVLMENGRRFYSVGTLRYTIFGLINLFIWMLWGDFCFTLMETLIPSLLPIFMKNHGSSNLLIGLVVGSIPALLNFIINPVVSTYSDRTRTRWGRRIPYLLFASPFVTLFLILLGWSDQIGAFVNSAVLGGDYSTAGVILGCITVFAIGFQFFNMFVFSVFYYIFADVVPKQFMGRFMALFRMVGTVAGFIYQRYIFKHADTHMAWIFTGIAVIYLLAFLLMCFCVKEGEYPPPEPKKGNAIATYFRECFSLSFYRWFFLAMACNDASTVCRTMFNFLFANKSLGLDFEQYGNIMSINMVISFFLLIPMGFLVDWLYPLRTYIAGAFLVIAMNIFGFFFVQDYHTFFAVAILIAVVYVIQNASKLPMFVALLPGQKYGQFCSANAMVVSVFLIIANALGGWFIDLFGYRFIFVWDFLFTALGLVALLKVYSIWKQRGGRSGYTAPMV